MTSTITYTRVGTETSGDAAMLRTEAAPAWRMAVALVLLLTGIDLSTRIIQAQGGAATSAGTHSDGVAVDLRVWYLSLSQISRIVAILRECGWSATWFRDWTGNRHIHAVLDLKRTTNASYQITAVKRGRDGLAAGGPDPHPEPSAWRDYITGPVWAAAQIAQANGQGDTTDTDTEGVLDMTQESTYTHAKSQVIAAGKTRYLAATKEGWWKIPVPAGPVVLSVAGYATTGTGKAGSATIWIVAENDTKKTSRVIGRMPVELTAGYGSISGSAVAVLASGEVVRLKAAGGSRPITIGTLTTTALH